MTRTYHQQGSPADLRPVSPPDPAPRIERVGECPPSFYRYLYAEVGRAFRWTDRLGWSDETIRTHLFSTPGLSLWLLTWEAAPAGYFELKPHDDASVEIAYFGLLPEYIGRGWGKYLLSEAVREAGAEASIIFVPAAGMVSPTDARLAPHLHAGPSGGPAELSEPRLPRRAGGDVQRRDLSAARLAGSASSAARVRARGPRLLS